MKKENNELHANHTLPSRESPSNRWLPLPALAVHSSARVIAQQDRAVVWGYESQRECFGYKLSTLLKVHTNSESTTAIENIKPELVTIVRNGSTLRVG